MMGPSGKGATLEVPGVKDIWTLLQFMENKEGVKKYLKMLAKATDEHKKAVNLAGGLKAAEKIIAVADAKQHEADEVVAAAKSEATGIVSGAETKAAAIEVVTRKRLRDVRDAEADIERRVAAVAKLQTDAQTTNDAATVRLEKAVVREQEARSHEAEMKRKLAAVTAAAA